MSVISIFPYFLNNYIVNQDDLLFHRSRLESYYQAVKHLDFFQEISQHRLKTLATLGRSSRFLF